MVVPHVQQGFRPERGVRRKARQHISNRQNGATGHPRHSALHLIAKRSLDIGVSAMALVILLPLMLMIALLIRLDSPGNALFTQARWGKGMKTIRIFKFRTMYIECCDASGIRQTVANDPRVTRVGAVLRRTNLDELPQLLNVLLGDMSLVGPRCHAIGMLAAGVPYEHLVPDYHHRHQMRPGITGLAQMRGLRGPTDRPARARARIVSDLYYVENFSFWLDLKIIAGTLKAECLNSSGF
ncbi:sugar transferase [Allorhizobium undicola]|uniref:sugar transferase n=1 Tax=Allorhizobium undicola TaxID=78527 RepID=UPI000A003FC5|nr:sugar transferase [Allorhizobium undicola]